MRNASKKINSDSNGSSIISKDDNMMISQIVWELKINCNLLHDKIKESAALGFAKV